MSIQYDKATYCTKGAAAGTTALAKTVKERFPFVSHTGIYNCRNIRGADSFSTHAEGRGLDIHVKTIADGEKITAWLFANREIYGLQEIIFNRKIWTSPKAEQGWRKYTGQNPHTDHVHTAQNRRSAGVTIQKDDKRLILADLEDANGDWGLETLSNGDLILPTAVVLAGAAAWNRFSKRKK